MIASSILKDEAIENYKTISKLNAQAFAKEINQDISNIEILIDNIPSIINLFHEKEKIVNMLTNMLRNYPQIRSINVTNHNKIIYSSNIDNIGFYIDDKSFFLIQFLMIQY